MPLGPSPKPPITGRALVLALLGAALLLIQPGCRLVQTGKLAPIFQPAIADILPRTHLPILLPSQLPPALRPSDIRLASGELRKDGYFISLYYSDLGSESSFAAGFGGSTRLFTGDDQPSARRVLLSGARRALFRPLSCNGSCAPANLWWVHDGVQYNIQAMLDRQTPDPMQAKVLIALANASVPAHKD